MKGLVWGVFLVLTLLLAGSASAYYPYHAEAYYAQPYALHYGQGWYGGYNNWLTGYAAWEPAPVVYGPNMAELFDPPLPMAKGEEFCHTYALDDPFPIAAHFDKTISVKYTIQRDSSTQPYWGRVSRSMRGYATFYERANCAGLPVDQEDFTAKMSWDDRYSEDGFHVRWWAPGVDKLNFELFIKRYGKFTAQNDDDRWEWAGRSFTQPTVRTSGYFYETIINAFAKVPYR